MLVVGAEGTDFVDGARRAAYAGYGALKVLLLGGDHHRMRQAARIADLVERFAAIKEVTGWASTCTAT